MEFEGGPLHNPYGALLEDYHSGKLGDWSPRLLKVHGCSMGRVGVAELVGVRDDTYEAAIALNHKEGLELFQQACQRKLGINAAEFLYYHEYGTFPSHWSHSDIEAVKILLPFLRESE